MSAWRHRAGLSQETLARAVGLAPTALSKIENGKQSLTVETFLELLVALKLNLADIASDLPKPAGLGGKPLWERIND